MTRVSRLLRTAIALGLAVPTASLAERHQFEQPCMGTVFTIVVHSDAEADEVKAAAERAFAIGQKLDSIFSDYKADSTVGLFHREPAGEAFSISPEFRDLIQLAAKFHRETGGAFDVANGSLTRLWRFSQRTEKLPEADVLRKAISAAGMKNIDFDAAKRTLRRTSSDTRLDFGGIAKGHAADHMLASLKADGFPSTSVAAAGDIAVGAPPPSQSGWRIELRPYGDRPESARVILLAHAAVSTSGNAEQFISIGGVRYSHIVDPKTGLGMTAARAASVIAPTAAQADAYATALCLLGRSGLERITADKAVHGAVFEESAADSEFSKGFPTGH